MTRINVVPVQELTSKHLVAEYREIVRVFALVRKAQSTGLTISNFHKMRKVPPDYTLGTGHVTFFYNKLGYVLKRYHSLIEEMRNREYNPNPISDSELQLNINSSWFGDYIPTRNAIEINRQRIQLRLQEAFTKVNNKTS